MIIFWIVSIAEPKRLNVLSIHIQNLCHVDAKVHTLLHRLLYWLSQTYLVILKIRNSLKALSTLIPNDVPGLKNPQTTSKILPMITCAQIRDEINDTNPHLYSQWGLSIRNNNNSSGTVFCWQAHKMIQQWNREKLWTAHLPHNQSSWRRSGSRGGSQDRTSSETSQPRRVPETRTRHSLQKVRKHFKCLIMALEPYIHLHPNITLLEKKHY